jgi:hypothetical protein
MIRQASIDLEIGRLSPVCPGYACRLKRRCSMSKVESLWIVICFLSLTFVASCVSGQDNDIKIPDITEKEISSNEIDSVMSKYNTGNPFGDLKPGSVYYAVVIPVDIPPMSGNTTYDEVRVTMDIIETVGTTNHKDTGKIRILAAIPESVARNSDVEVVSKVAAGFAAAIDEMKVNVGADWSKKETYERLARIVTANHPTITTVYWTFTPFQDEPIAPGINYLIALIEVRDQTHEFSAEVHTDCTYGAPILFGLLGREKNSCAPYAKERRLLPPEQSPQPQSTSDIVGIDVARNDHVYAWYLDGTFSSGSILDFDKYSARHSYAVPGGKSPGDIIGMGIACSDDHVYTWYKDGTVSAGSSWGLDEYRPLYRYTLPSGKSPRDILGISISSKDYVYAWYTDGTVSAGSSWNLGEYSPPVPYTVAPGKSAADIVGLGIACSNDSVYTWYIDGSVSQGTIGDLDE